MSDTPGVERVDTAEFTVPTDFQHMLAAGAVDCLQADITRCGGVTVRLRTAALAQVRGTEISGTAPRTRTPPRSPTCATWSGSTTAFA